MALKALMLRKKIDDKRKRLEALREKDSEMESRERDIESSIEEAKTDEEKRAVEEAVDGFEQDKEAHENAKSDLEREIESLENELSSVEADEESKARVSVSIKGTRENVKTEEREMNTTEKRDFFGMSVQERDAFFMRDDIKDFIQNVREIRSKQMEQRDISNGGLLIPDVIIGLIRENIENYSKLYKYVNVVHLRGNGREIIAGTIPEAVWTECCANLNELTIAFNDVEIGCWKVGGFFSICNATLEDSMINLASEFITDLGQAIGIALDKAILYGTGTRMPLGVVTRLAQTSAPSDYPDKARPWADLHKSNVASVPADATGVALYQAIVSSSGAMINKYSKGTKVWVMNEKTYTSLQVNAMSINAAGAIVAGQNGTMPVIGGAIEQLSFIPDNVIIGGYFDLYLLGERADVRFAQSEHYKFIEDRTIFKATARYDGQPVIPEAFIALGINGTTPDATMTFAADTANTGA